MAFSSSDTTRNSTCISAPLPFLQPCSINFPKKSELLILNLFFVCVWGNLCQDSYSVSLLQERKFICCFVLDFLSLELPSPPTSTYPPHCHNVYSLPKHSLDWWSAGQQRVWDSDDMWLVFGYLTLAVLGLEIRKATVSLSEWSCVLKRWD
jgi:hypothetical protein